MAVKNNEQKKPHACPFCDEAIAEAAFPYCEACGVKVLRCPSCQAVIRRDVEKCPQCGADLNKAATGG